MKLHFSFKYRTKPDLQFAKIWKRKHLKIQTIFRELLICIMTLSNVILDLTHHCHTQSSCLLKRGKNTIHVLIKKSQTYLNSNLFCHVPWDVQTAKCHQDYFQRTKVCKKDAYLKKKTH